MERKKWREGGKAGRKREDQEGLPSLHRRSSCQSTSWSSPSLRCRDRGEGEGEEGGREGGREGGLGKKGRLLCVNTGGKGGWLPGKEGERRKDRT
jgi:hypothetical protein